MKQIVLFLIQLFFSIYLYGQEDDYIKLDYNYFYLKDSLQNNKSFEKTIENIEHSCSNDVQKISLIAGWIFNNINFDIEKLINGGVVEHYKTVFDKKKGTCGEYSNLFSEFCNRLGIQNEIIEGYVPELNSNHKAFYETNHAWNVVKINGKWYHCDLLELSGYLDKKSNGELEFIKNINPKSILTQEFSFIINHIPADPMWQLSNYPIPIDTILKYGILSKKDTTGVSIDFENEILSYISKSEQEKLLQFTDDAYNYNKNNNNIVIVNYYNVSVDLINNWKGDKQKLQIARKYLLKAKSHLHGARNGVENLVPEIDVALGVIKQYLP